MQDASGATTAEATADTGKPRVVVASHALPEEIQSALAARFEVLPPGQGTECEVLISDPGVGATADMMDDVTGLKLVALFGVGVDAVDLRAAAKRGLAVTNTPGMLTDAVADHAMALLLASARNVAAGDRYVRDGQWTSLVAKLPLGRGLAQRRLGIVGLGRIGRAIAERAAAFGMTIAWHGPREKDAPWPYVADPETLARDSDFLVLACPGGEATRGLVGRSVLDALGPQGTLVNVARGSVVDEPALVAALGEGRLGFAALDVFADEPKVPGDLLDMPNVVIAPHQGSATRDARIAMGELMIENVTAHFQGRSLPTPVALPEP